MTHALPLPLRRWLLLQLILLGLALIAWPAWAGERGDPPTRVARVAELDGPALWFDPETRDWQPLVRNQTLAEGDRLRAGDGGRIGLRIGAHGLWLDERSELELRRLDDGRIELELERGALALRWLSRETAEEAVLRTGDGRFRFERAGAYRIDQLRRASRAQVFEGRLRFDHRGQDDAPLIVDAGEQAELWWEGGPRAERSRLQRGDDRFGDWLVASLGFGRQDVASLRDRPAYRYLSPELTGADELDQHGRWEVSSQFGPVWLPLRVAVDWAPYRYGRWTWTRHWGWTWVDDLPWGYATSHYGRWVHWRGRWCWAPGAVVHHRPVFAPALVTWVGSGGVQVGVQIGHRHAPPLAWVPLAPHERYQPWYRHSPRYQQRFDPDPVTVRRPQPGGSWVGHNRDVPGAISTLAEVGPRRDGGRPQVVPVRDEQLLRQLRPLPEGPTRQLAQEAGLPAGAWRGDARMERPDRPERVDRLDRGERVERVDRIDRLERIDRVDAGERPLRRESPAMASPAPSLPRAESVREVELPRRVETWPEQRREAADEMQRTWRPAPRVEMPRAEMSRPEMPMPARPEPRRIEAPRPVEAPRAMEAPRAIEAPRRVEQPRAEPARRGPDSDAGPRRQVER